jgi:hypothetical protein
MAAGIAALLAFGLFAGVPAAQETCTVEPLTAEALAAGPEALNGNLACLDRRLRALEAQSAGDAAAAQTGSGVPIAQTTILETIRVSLDYASIVDNKQVLLEFSIENTGDEMVLAIIAAFQDSSVTLRGEAGPRALKVQGFATCPTFQNRETRNCIDRTQDESWTVLDPGVLHEFRISTQASGDDITADAAAATIRMIVRNGGEAGFQDVSFARIPLAD